MKGEIMTGVVVLVLVIIAAIYAFVIKRPKSQVELEASMKK